MRQKSIIKVKNLRKTYGKLVAVNNISFEVMDGEIFGILGPNGAGKTTTVEMLEGLKPIDEGEVLIDEVNVNREPSKVKKLIGVQLQSTTFFDNLTCAELIAIFASFYEREVDPMVYLKKVNLEEKAKVYPKHLSGGQKQRLSIALALVNNPKVIFLDEPTTGLDPQARRNLWELISNIRTNDKKTVVLTTHYMEEAEELCDRVAIMDNARIIAIDTPRNLIQKLLDKGFQPRKQRMAATLDDVFLDLTGKQLRE